MPDKVEVTQADRDAAADLLESAGSKGILCRFDHAITIRHTEDLDGDPFAQAFALHRIAAEKRGAEQALAGLQGDAAVEELLNAAQQARLRLEMVEAFKRGDRNTLPQCEQALAHLSAAIATITDGREG